MLGYWDIFKNFYANKQEENYYMIDSNDEMEIEINYNTVNNNYNIPENIGIVKNNEKITIQDH